MTASHSFCNELWVQSTKSKPYVNSLVVCRKSTCAPLWTYDDDELWTWVVLGTHGLLRNMPDIR